MDDDPFEDWERYPAVKSEEQLGYQRLAWFAAPFGSTAIVLLVFAAAINLLRRLGRQVIRLAYRLKLV